MVPPLRHPQRLRRHLPPAPPHPRHPPLRQQHRRRGHRLPHGPQGRQHHPAHIRPRPQAPRRRQRRRHPAPLRPRRHSPGSRRPRRSPRLTLAARAQQCAAQRCAAPRCAKAAPSPQKKRAQPSISCARFSAPIAPILHPSPLRAPQPLCNSHKKSQPQKLAFGRGDRI